MSLTKILSPLAAELGVKLAATQERQFLVDEINRAALELHTLNDLRGCERENTFQFDLAAYQVALPYYVDKIFAARHYDTKIPVELNDMHPRYASANWSFLDTHLYKWRLKGTSPLKVSLEDPTPLTISLPLANTIGFNVLIIGGTINSARITEVVNFSATDTTKTTVNVFSSIEKIHRIGTCNYDLTIKDLDSRELAKIPNTEEDSVYKIIQIMDTNQNLAQDSIVEVLFKIRYVPVVNDYDSFVFGDAYDEAIYYLVLSKLLAKNPTKVDAASLAFTNSQRLLVGITQNQDDHIDQRIKFGTIRTMEIQKELSNYGTL